jgi:hypothetical protein
MQIMQANENSNLSHSATTKSVVRPIASKGSTYELTSDSKTIHLDDGHSIVKCSPVTNCRFFPNCNKLLRVTYYSNNGKNVIDGYDLPSLDEVITYYGFELQQAEDEESSQWNLPLQKVSSPSLSELTAAFRRIWASLKQFDPYEFDFTISRPNAKVELHNIIYTVNDLSFTNTEERDESVIGAYLFCIFKTYQIIDGRISDLDRQILDAINQALCEIEGRNRHLANRLQQYINIASESILNDLSGYQPHALMVRDVYEHFHP